jgi:hypothetical protein
LTTFTLDTNCIIAVDERRPEAKDVLRLAQAHSEEKADVAVVAISASERQKDGRLLELYGHFNQRLEELGLGALRHVFPMAYFDITFYDACLLSDRAMALVERNVHNILFPSVEFDWEDFCKARGMDAATALLNAKWRNAKCDVQALWAHINAKRDVFVTSDANFHAATKKPQLVAMGAGQIVTPAGAVKLLRPTH